MGSPGHGFGETAKTPPMPMDGPKSDRGCCISKYLQLNCIDCDESVKCQSSNNKKSSLAVIGIGTRAND